MKKILFTILIIAAALFYYQFSRAQLNISASLSLKLTTTTPLPNSRAVASAALSGSAASGANFTWFLNNVRQSDNSGPDKNTFSFPVGNLGSAYTVSVSVSTSAGENLRDSISFTVSDVDITWNALNEAPPDYESKTLPSGGSKVTASASPIAFAPGTKTQLNPNNLIYRWFLNDVFDSNNSGLGKSVYRFAVGLSNENLKVQVANSQNTVLIEKSIIIPVVAPKLFVFLSDASGNVLYKNAVLTLTTKLNQKLSLKAVPYFFNLLPSQLNWSWFVNDQKMMGAPKLPWLATFTVPADTAVPANFQMTANAVNPFAGQENASALINISAK